MELKQTIQLVHQMDVSVAIGETPVLNGESDKPVTTALQIVNFLRSGCPSVQLLFGESEYPAVADKEATISIVRSLALKGETFEVEESAKDTPYLIVTVSRKVPTP